MNSIKKSSYVYTDEDLDEIEHNLTKNDLLQQIDKLKEQFNVSESLPYIYLIKIYSKNGSFVSYVKVGIVNENITNRMISIFTTFCPMEYIEVLALIKIDTPLKYEKRFHKENKDIRLTDITSGNFDKKSRECYPYEAGIDKFISFYRDELKEHISDESGGEYFNMKNKDIAKYFAKKEAKKVAVVNRNRTEIASNTRSKKVVIPFIEQIKENMKCSIYVKIGKKTEFEWKSGTVISISNDRRNSNIKKIKVVFDDENIKYNILLISIEEATYDVLWRI